MLVVIYTDDVYPDGLYPDDLYPDDLYPKLCLVSIASHPWSYICICISLLFAKDLSCFMSLI